MKMAQKAHKILRSEWENENKIDPPFYLLPSNKAER
jgi:hypothetical protein